jgi:hypothetical protein
MPYRENAMNLDECERKISELETRLTLVEDLEDYEDDDEDKPVPAPTDIGDNRLLQTVWRVLGTTLVLVTAVISGACLLSSFSTNKANVDIAKYNADQAREVAVKAMWDHIPPKEPVK